MSNNLMSNVLIVCIHVYILYFLKIKNLKLCFLDQNIVVKELNILYKTLRFKIKLSK